MLKELKGDINIYLRHKNNAATAFFPLNFQFFWINKTLIIDRKGNLKVL